MTTSYFSNSEKKNNIIIAGPVILPTICQICFLHCARNETVRACLGTVWTFLSHNFVLFLVCTCFQAQNILGQLAMGPNAR
jgi:hypothetical protein